MNNKSLIVPIATLAVSLLLFVGVGYALNASVYNVGNDVTISDKTINLYDDGSGEISVTTPVFSNGDISYRTFSDEDGIENYRIVGDQKLNMTVDPTYLKSNDHGEVTVKIIWSPENIFMKNVEVTIGIKTVILDTENSFTASFTNGNHIDVSDNPLKVIMKGTTKEYVGAEDPRDVTFSVKFILNVTSQP